MLKPRIIRGRSRKAEFTPEHCFIAELWGSNDDNALSIARAIVKPNVTTAAHHLSGVNEIYIICHGVGEISIEGLEKTEVKNGDLIFIPASTSQKITNTGKTDLVFYCICTPKFTTDCYRNDEKSVPKSM